MEITKNTIYLSIGLLAALILVLLLFGGVSIYLRKPPELPNLEPRVREEISEEEILKSLTAPSETKETLPEVAESLTAPGETKKTPPAGVLENLTAPEQKEE